MSVLAGSLSRRRTGAFSALLLVLLAVVLVAAQGAMSRYQVSLLTTLLLYVAAASAWNIIGGIAGQFSLASSAFIGVGSYTVIMSLRDSRMPLWFCIALATVLGAAFAAVMGLILFRLRGFYFTIGTLAAAVATLTWMTTWSFTGATTGISAPLDVVPSSGSLYLIALAVAVVTVAASIVVYYTAYGLRLMAVRDDEDVADSLGVSPLRTKMIAMVVSGGLTATVGAIFALQKVSVEPFSAFNLDWSITIIVMAIVGGLGTIWGPAIGAVVVYYGITVQLQSVPALSAILSGVLLIVMIRFLPHGIVGGAQFVGRTLAARLRRPRPARG